MLISRICILTAIVALLMTATGCISNDKSRLSGIDAVPVELASTPFYPQTQYQCGPAALATILESSGLEISIDHLSREVYLPGREGTLQLEIIAAVRRHDLVPYEPDGTLQSLVDQLNNGLPVLVLLNTGLDILPAWHYAVVIGYLPEKNKVILRSGTDYRLEMSRRSFETAWDKAGRWSLLALQPGQLPARVDIERYLNALIAIEETGNWKTAESGYRAVLTHTPQSRLALFGLANALRANGQPEAAVNAYQELISREPGHLPARNNLADTLLKLSQCHEATEVIAETRPDSSGNPTINDAIKETNKEIHSACTTTTN